RCFHVTGVQTCALPISHQLVAMANQFRLAIEMGKAFILTAIDTRMQHLQGAHVVAAHINKTTAEIAVAGGLRHVLEQLLGRRFAGGLGRQRRNLCQGDDAGERLQQCSPTHQRLSFSASWVTKRTPPITPWPLWRETNSLWRTIMASIRSLSACREAACAWPWFWIACDTSVGSIRRGTRVSLATVAACCEVL